MVICFVTIWIWKDSIKDPITSEKSSLLYKIFLVDFDNGLVHLKVRCGSSSTCLSITVAVEEHLFLSFAFERSIKRPSPFLPPSLRSSDSLWRKSTGTALQSDSAEFNPEIQLVFDKKFT